MWPLYGAFSCLGLTLPTPDCGRSLNGAPVDLGRSEKVLTLALYHQVPECRGNLVIAPYHWHVILRSLNDCLCYSSLNNKANPPLFADIRDGPQTMSSTLNLTYEKEDGLCKGKRHQPPHLPQSRGRNRQPTYNCFRGRNRTIYGRKPTLSSTE